MEPEILSRLKALLQPEGVPTGRIRVVYRAWERYSKMNFVWPIAPKGAATVPADEFEYYSVLTNLPGAL